MKIAELISTNDIVIADAIAYGAYPSTDRPEEVILLLEVDGKKIGATLDCHEQMSDLTDLLQRCMIRRLEVALDEHKRL